MGVEIARYNSFNTLTFNIDLNNSSEKATPHVTGFSFYGSIHRYWKSYIDLYLCYSHQASASPPSKTIQSVDADATAWCELALGGTQCIKQKTYFTEC